MHNSLGRGGHKTRYPNPEPEIPKPEPEIPEIQKTQSYFGYEVQKPEIISDNSGFSIRYLDYPKNPKLYEVCLTP